MANGSMSTNSGGEGQIRAQIVEADLVSCVVALPTQLFRSTGIPVCLWFFAKDKKAGKQGSINRTGEVLFIDARNLGYMVDRAERSFTDADIAGIAGTYQSWRGTPSATRPYRDEPAFCASASLDDIKAGAYSLTPGRYVGSIANTLGAEELDQTIDALTTRLLKQFEESRLLASIVETQLARLA